jgi:hypothetical protein
MSGKPHVTMKYREPEAPKPTTAVQKDDPIPPQNVPWFFKTVLTAPTAAPRGWWEQVQILYDTGVHLYVWSTHSSQWYHLDF